jgi:hypothetical protein
MKKNKIWLCGITKQGNEENLKELIEPIKQYFNGLVWTFHLPIDEGSNYLESAKGEGKIIYTDWTQRYDFARNHYLFSNIIKEGDWFFNIDSEERLSKEFCKNLNNYINIFESEGIDSIYYEGKFLAFKFNEWMYWRNSIHEHLIGSNKGIDLKGTKPFDDNGIRFNLRNEKRNRFDFVEQALRYYLTLGSIHCLLACENNQDFFQRRMQIRTEFRNHILNMGIDPTDTKSIIDFISQDNLDEITKKCINFEKYLNDAYRYFKLKLEDFDQDFDFKNLIKI